VRAGEIPPQPLHGEVHLIADPMPLRSFKDLCEKADLIVDGVAETEASRLTSNRAANIETDFWIAVNRVLKGPAETRKVVVSEIGGTVGDLRVIPNYRLLQRGERYILFLYTDKRTDVPKIEGLARYRDDTFYGQFHVTDGKIEGPRTHAKYDGMTPDALAAEIMVQLGR
jgi:hypothetical protein